MNINILNEIKEEDRDRAIKLLINGSSPRQSFFFMVAMSVAMATMGLLLNSTAVVIGSMLIAPVLFPILSIAMGLIISDTKLSSRSFETLIKAILLSLAVAALVAFVFSFQQPDITNEIIKRTQPNLLNFGIAVVAGMAVAFAITKPSINESMPGVAISVSLVPPIGVVGIGLAKLDLTIIGPAIVLLVINIVGIMFSAMVIFSLARFATRRDLIHQQVVNDEIEVTAQQQPNQ